MRDLTATVSCEVQRIQPYQAAKTYLCPGCNRDIPPGTGHIVAIPVEAPDLRRRDGLAVGPEPVRVRHWSPLDESSIGCAGEVPARTWRPASRDDQSRFSLIFADFPTRSRR